jgi:hypothetical protein
MFFVCGKLTTTQLMKLSQPPETKTTLTATIKLAWGRKQNNCHA